MSSCQCKANAGAERPRDALHTSTRKVCRLSLGSSGSMGPAAHIAHFPQKKYAGSRWAGMQLETILHTLHTFHTFFQKKKEKREKQEYQHGSRPSANRRVDHLTTSVHRRRDKVKKSPQCVQVCTSPTETWGEAWRSEHRCWEGRCKSVHALHTCLKKYAH